MHEFHVCAKTIRKIWARTIANFENLDIPQFCASPKKLGRSGRPRKWNHDDILVKRYYVVVVDVYSLKRKAY